MMDSSILVLIVPKTFRDFVMPAHFLKRGWEINCSELKVTHAQGSSRLG